jgi:hypothetical protein
MKTALELIAAELQGVRFSDADIARAVALAKPSNDKVREAADKHMKFEDEPAHYLALLNK